jgi:peroxiredoxin Q/BCP
MLESTRLKESHMTRQSEGDIAPDFSAVLQDGSRIRLSELLESKSKTGIILYFYPKDSTPGCTTQACDFRDNWNILTTAGWRVLGVSKDGEVSHKKFIDKYQLPFDLIVDTDAKLMEAYGAWGEKKNYGRKYFGVIRSTIVIDSNGKIIWARYGVKAKGHVDRLLKALGI